MRLPENFYPGFFAKLPSSKKVQLLFEPEPRRAYTALQIVVGSPSKLEAIKYLVERAGYSVHARDSVNKRTLLYPLLHCLAEELDYRPNISELSLSEKQTHCKALVRQSQAAFNHWRQDALQQKNSIQEKITNYKQASYHPTAQMYAFPDTIADVEFSRALFQKTKQGLADIEKEKRDLQTKQAQEEKEFKKQIESHEIAFAKVQQQYSDCFAFLRDLTDSHCIALNVKDAHGETPLDILEKEIPIKLLERKTKQLNAALRNASPNFIKKYHHYSQQKVVSDEISQAEYAWYLLSKELNFKKKAMREIWHFLSSMYEEKNILNNKNASYLKPYPNDEIIDDTLHIVLQETTIVGTIKTLIRNGHNPNEQNLLGATVLHDAVVFASDKMLIEIIDYLIAQEKVKVNIQDQLGNTPLHYSVGQRITQRLLDAHADCLTRNKQGYTPLEMACIKQDFEKIHCLLNYIDLHNLATNIKSNALDLIIVNIEQSFVEFSNQLNSSNIMKNALHQESHLAILSYLLTDPIHPLSLALLTFLNSARLVNGIESTQIEQCIAFISVLFPKESLTQKLAELEQAQIVVKRLLKEGIRGSHALVLHHAIKYLSAPDIRKWMAQDSIDVNMRADKCGNTILYFAREETTAGLLLDKGAKFLLNHIGKTPLHYACAQGNLDVVKCFLKRASSLAFDINAVDQYGYSALDITLKLTELLTELYNVFAQKEKPHFFSEKRFRRLLSQLDRQLENCKQIKQLLLENKACLIEYALESSGTTSSISESPWFEEAEDKRDPFLLVDYMLSRP